MLICRLAPTKCGDELAANVDDFRLKESLTTYTWVGRMDSINENISFVADEPFGKK